MGQILVNLSDALMVGRLGAVSLAAISLANSIFAVFLVFGMGISFALAPLVSYSDGADEHREISRHFKHSLVVNVLFALVFIGIIELLIPYFGVLRQDPDVLALAIPYLRISMWSVVPMMIFLAMRGYSEGLSKTMPPMIAIIVGNVINIVLNYVLIFGKLGMPDYGVKGAAYSSLFARVLMAVIMFILIYYNKPLWNIIKQTNFFRYQRKRFVKVLKLGIPTAFQMGFEVSAFSGAAIIMGMISSDAQAAHLIAINMASITFLVCTGLAMAGTIRVGNLLGQKAFVKLRNAGFSVMIQVSVFMCITGIIFIVFREWLPYLYIEDEQVVQIATLLLVYASIFQIPDGIQVTALGALRGFQDVRIPTIITLLAYWVVGIPLSYFAGVVWSMGPGGVWLGLIAGLTISSIWLFWRFNAITKPK